MEIFKNKIEDYERKLNNLTFIARKGELPIILTAAHTMMQLKENGEYKNSEPYTKAIAMYVAEKTDCFYLIKNKDTGIDSNLMENDTLKNMLLDNIKKQNNS